MEMKFKDVSKHLHNNRAWYIKGVNINYSFKSLKRIAEEMGAKIENGDCLIADNINGDKRKVFKQVPNGSMILYVGLNKGREFLTLKDSKGKLRGNKSLLEWGFDA